MIDEVLYYASKKQDLKIIFPDKGDIIAYAHQESAITNLFHDDNKFDIGYYRNDKEFKCYIYEKVRGNISELKTSVSLYKLPITDFIYNGDNYISKKPIKIIKEIKIPDVLSVLRNSNCDILLNLKTAVIITGNPKYIIDNPLAITFYKELKQFLETELHIKQVKFDKGREFTEPPPADLWVGHSRGCDRLRFSPPKTITVALGDISGIYHKKDNTVDENFKTSNKKPNKFHYMLDDEIKEKIKKKIAEDI